MPSRPATTRIAGLLLAGPLAFAAALGAAPSAATTAAPESHNYHATDHTRLVVGHTEYREAEIVLDCAAGRVRLGDHEIALDPDARLDPAVREARRARWLASPLAVDLMAQGKTEDEAIAAYRAQQHQFVAALQAAVNAWAEARVQAPAQARADLDRSLARIAEQYAGVVADLDFQERLPEIGDGGVAYREHGWGGPAFVLPRPRTGGPEQDPPPAPCEVWRARISRILRSLEAGDRYRIVHVAADGGSVSYITCRSADHLAQRVAELTAADRRATENGRAPDDGRAPEND